jgi:hypothetical protein
MDLVDIGVAKSLLWRAFEIRTNAGVEVLSGLSADGAGACASVFSVTSISTSPSSLRRTGCINGRLVERPTAGGEVEQACNTSPKCRSVEPPLTKANAADRRR